MSRFCPSCEEELGEHDRYYINHVALKGRSSHNYHLTILKGLELLRILLKKKEKKDMAFLTEKKKLEFQW